MQKGAQPTDTVRRILSFKGVLYLKHLLRGVKLGLFDEPTAYKKFEQWQADHEQKVSARRESQKKARVAAPVVRKVEEAPAAPAEPAAEGEAEA
ncbi:hypothetical protein [Chitinophaga sedimenti]|uniref:hypothetical protein n=1 Tax=Chitinophaga sedimenti TaxID=2033606 RepID=UPI00249F29AB|nr:hypothetical protein [Chitinophaga sedimenti]